MFRISFGKGEVLRECAMGYLKNAWYAGAWARELGETPLARTIHDQPIVFFRGSDGAPAALHDACPHRFAPLSRGKVSSNSIVCGYHGLEFDRTGLCIRNPHGKGAVPRALAVRKYPLAERYGVIWIWPGDADKADAALIPSLPILEDPEFSWVEGHLHVSANYELLIDNLLDLSHVEFLHPFLSSPGSSQRTTFRVQHDGDQVSAIYDVSPEPISGLFQLLMDGDKEMGDMHACMQWNPPSSLYLDTTMRYSGASANESACVPTVHLLTPETEDSTHYFWSAGRNRLHGDEHVSEMLFHGVQSAFANEDEPMIRAVRTRMHSNDLFAHKPALLPIDAAAVRARRVLARLIAGEAGEA